MKEDEMHIRNLLRKWERQFVDSEPITCQEIIDVRNSYAKKYSYEELFAVYHDVVLQVAREMLGEM